MLKGTGFNPYINAPHRQRRSVGQGFSPANINAPQHPPGFSPAMRREQGPFRPLKCRASRLSGLQPRRDSCMLKGTGFSPYIKATQHPTLSS